LKAQAAWRQFARTAKAGAGQGIKKPSPQAAGASACTLRRAGLKNDQGAIFQAK
jgi:hypothetical protein